MDDEQMLAITTQLESSKDRIPLPQPAQVLAMIKLVRPVLRASAEGTAMQPLTSQELVELVDAAQELSAYIGDVQIGTTKPWNEL